MSEYTKDEALAFIDAMRLTLQDKVGFKWLVERLSGLAGFVDSICVENALLRAFVDESHQREAFASFAARYSQPPENGCNK